MNEERKIAILVDGDNAQPKLLKQIIDEVAKYGKATIRRIYGDWTSVQMNGWKIELNETSFSPIQKFAYTSGKNSTDSALIIDAMDILYSKNVDGFCIVSSDSDYTGLAKRIREEGILVIGIGEKKTPSAFIQSCEIFTFCENLIIESTSPSAKTSLSKELITFIDKAYDKAAGDDDQAYMSEVGNIMRKIDPTFDVRSHGFSTLSALLKSLDSYEVIDNKVGALNHYLLKRK